MISLEELIGSSGRLPPFPALIRKAMEVINRPNSSLQEVVETIQYDQAITANVLKVINSAAFGLRQPVGSLRDAVMLLGYEQLLEIILSGSMASALERRIPGYDLEAGELWKHSVSSALLTRIISRRLNREPNPLIFTAALIHDIGKVILHSYVQEEFLSIKEKVRHTGTSFLEAEKEVLGVDHAELSAGIIEQWNFPGEIVQAVRHHHTPLSAGSEREAVYLIYLSDLIAMLTGIGGGIDGLSYSGFDQVMQYFGLEEKDIEWFMAQLGDQVQKVEAMIRVQ
jgi:putative nucleotidyltransferase with HDIG domain